MKSWLALNKQVVGVLGDGYKGSMEENSTYSALVRKDYSWSGCEDFSDGGSIGMMDCGGEDDLCVWVEMWEFILMSAFG